MDEVNEKFEPEQSEIVDVEAELSAEEKDVLEGNRVDGSVHISEEVISELAKKALLKIQGIQPANAGLASKIGLGRKTTEGIRISLEDSPVPEVTVDAYVMVKYGLRIPDIAWDVQESVKKELESFTGYTVKAVNVNVQGIYFNETVATPSSDSKEELETESDEESVSAACEPESDTESEISPETD